MLPTSTTNGVKGFMDGHGPCKVFGTIEKGQSLLIIYQDLALPPATNRGRQKLADNRQ